MAILPAAAQQKHRLLAEQIPEPPRHFQPHAPAPGVERHRLLDLGAGYAAELAEILDAAKRSASLVRQLLAFSRKQTLQPEVLDLNAVVKNLEKMLGRLIGEDVVLKLALFENLDTVMADVGQIEQVLMNLAVNAKDAMPKGGRIVIETQNVELSESYTALHSEVVPGSYVMLSVSDTGAGMEKDTQSKIFEPFFTTK